MSRRFQIGSVTCIRGVWKGRYRLDEPGENDRTQPQVTLGTKAEMTKAEARRKLADIIDGLGLNKSNYVEKLEGPVTTFNNVADAWIAKRLPQLALSTQDAAPKLIDKHMRPFFGRMSLEFIKTRTVNEWIAILEKSLEPKTIHNRWKDFRGMMNWHARQNDEPKRTWYPDLPDIPDTEQRWFPQYECMPIIEAAEGLFKPMFRLTAFSGMRSGEVCGLHVEDFDFNNGIVHVQRSIYKGVEVPVKGKRRRFVDLDSTTVQMVRDYLGGRAKGLIFQNRDGGPFDNHTIVCVLKSICKQVGLNPAGMHAFRHGRISHMQANNVPGDLIIKQVGHKTLRTTSLYTHFTKEFVRDTVEKLGQPVLVN